MLESPVRARAPVMTAALGAFVCLLMSSDTADSVFPTEPLAPLLGGRIGAVAVSELLDGAGAAAPPVFAARDSAGLPERSELASGLRLLFGWVSVNGFLGRAELVTGAAVHRDLS